MKKAVSAGKAFGVMGLLTHLVYCVLTIIELYFYFSGSEEGIRRSGAVWTFAVIIVPICLFFYLISVTFGIMTEEKMIYIVKLILVLAAIPMYIFIGGASGVADFIIWNVFFLILFVVHLVPLIIEFKQKRRYKRVVQTSPLPLQGRSEPEAASFPDEG